MILKPSSNHFNPINNNTLNENKLDFNGIFNRENGVINTLSDLLINAPQPINSTIKRGKKF